MKKCNICGKKFDPEYARRSIGQMFGAGVYDDYYPEADVCRDCAREMIAGNDAEGAEIIELMGSGWDND